MLPLAKIRAAAAAKFSEEDANFLQYGYISGYPEFRKSLAKFLTGHYKRGECLIQFDTQTPRKQSPRRVARWISPIWIVPAVAGAN